MKIFYDCEFLEDSKTIDLISIGLIREDGKEYYAVNKEFDKSRVLNHKWLMENVMSSIDHTVEFTRTGWGADIEIMKLTDPAARYRKEIARDIKEFVLGTPDPSLWAWFGAYDHVALCQLFGRMLDLPQGFPMYTNDIKTLHEFAGFPGLPKQDFGIHNALADAKHNMVRYNYLEELIIK